MLIQDITFTSDIKDAVLRLTIYIITTILMHVSILMLCILSSVTTVILHRFVKMFQYCSLCLLMVAVFCFLFFPSLVPIVVVMYLIMAICTAILFFIVDIQFVRNIIKYICLRRKTREKQKDGSGN